MADSAPPARLIPSLLFLLALASAAVAGPGTLPAPMPGIALERLFPGASFDPAIPSPGEALGIPLGGRPLRHGEILGYLRTLAETSPRATLLPYALSHEGRELVVLAVSDSATARLLDAFREEHARRMDPRGRSAGEDAATLREAKAVAWMAYAIHGDELSSSDAAVALAYRLVAGEDEGARRLRRELVVLIDPCQNPDGRERFLAQTTAFAHVSPNPDSEDLSHATVWPWGRGNHYLFDLNRDWFTLVQPESARSGLIASWHPQLVVDSHEMWADDTYLFTPARHPFNPHQPSSLRSWWDRFASDQAGALDERGYGYYTREWNEEFFPGYGSSWATYLGAVGILYEMSSTEGTLVRQRGGTVRTYAQAVEHQVTSSVANLGTLAANREEIVLDFVAQRRASIREGRDGAARAWIFPPGGHPDRARRLARLLRAQGIEVLRARERFDGKLLRDIRTGESRTLSLPSGTFMVRLDQPLARLARVLLDPHVPMEAAFLAEEREHLERGKGSRLYDTTAWSLPLLFGVDAYWTGAFPSGVWEPVDSIDEPEGRADTSAPASFGYILDGAPDAAAGAAADLLQRGVAVRAAEKPFRLGGRTFPRGSLLIKREGNPDDLTSVAAAVAATHGVEIVAAGTARAEQGPDLGGSHFPSLVAPRVGVWSGMPASPSQYGAVWHLLDQTLGLRFSALDIGRFSMADLRRYNVLVFPPLMGGPDGYRHRLGEQGVARLRSWVEGGGTAIGIGSGALFLAGEETALTKTRPRSEALDRFPPVVLGLGAREAAKAGLFRAVGLSGADGGDGERRRGEAGAAISPYDIAPLLGPGARPFAQGYDLGTPAPMTPVPLAEWLQPLAPRGEDKPSEETIERADRRLRRFSTGGTIVRADLDAEHWLTWGAGDAVDVLLRTGEALVAEPPVEVAARFADVERLHLGGLLWPEKAGRLALTASATREPVGRGQVILFADEPNLRGWTLDTRRLLANALVLGPGLGTSWAKPW
jgi:hypothetical protein